jgi:hypothetical protein
MSGRVDRVLDEIGQSLRPLSEAPRDGRIILAKSPEGFVVCRWDPSNLAGPSWTEANNAERGYLDEFFSGWIDPARLRLWNYATLADLLIAFIDDAYDNGDAKMLAILQRRARID